MQKSQHLYKSPNHAANLNNMRLKDKWCDITIKVGGRKIRAHKVILAANLKYFETMLSNDSFQETKEGVIIMKSVEEADLEAFVSYAYTGEILLTDTNASSLLSVANYLGEDEIKEACIEFAKKHFNAEQFCRVYRVANAIECLALKNEAKATIIANFRDCSKSANYLDLDHGCLMDILFDGKAQPIQSQQMLFEGIMRWVMHDAKERKIHMENLLGAIDITKLTSDDLIDYLYQSAVDRNDEFGIIKDTMFYFKTSKIERKKQGQVLVIVGGDYSINHRQFMYFQFYRFSEKKWFSPEKIPEAYACSNSAVLNDRLYFISYHYHSEKYNLQEFNPITKRSTALHCSSILRNAAVCACSRFVYMCGGWRDSGMSAFASNQVLRYDPQTNSFEKLTPMRYSRASAAAIFYQDCLYVLGGRGDKRDCQWVEKYNPNEKAWTDLRAMWEKRQDLAVAVLNEKLYACGGYNNSSVEVYDPAKNSWQQVDRMNTHRRSNFAVVAHEGKLIAVGGDITENTIEVYDPSRNRWQIDRELSAGLQMKYATGGLISAACIADAK